MNAFDDQAIDDEFARRRRQMLHVAGILMDVLGYSVRQALIVRGQFSENQVRRLIRSFAKPSGPERIRAVRRIVSELDRRQTARRSVPRKRSRPQG